MNKETQTVEGITRFQQAVDICEIDNNIQLGHLVTLHQQELEKVRREERERIRDVVNEEAKKSFYVGKEMWRNDAYKFFRKRIFDVVFKKPHDVRPCQYKCGYNIDWVISNDDGDEFQIAEAVQCALCGQLNNALTQKNLTDKE